MPSSHGSECQWTRKTAGSMAAVRSRSSECSGSTGSSYDKRWDGRSYNNGDWKDWYGWHSKSYVGWEEEYGVWGWSRRLQEWSTSTSLSPRPPSPPPPAHMRESEVRKQRSKRTPCASKKSAAEGGSAEEEEKHVEAGEEPDRDGSFALKIIVGKHELTGDGAVNVLVDFLKVQQLDSFATGCFLRGGVMDSSLFDECQSSKCAPVVTLSLPASCPCRPHLEEPIGPRGLEFAKQKLVGEALKILYQRGYIGEDLKPMKGAEPASRSKTSATMEPVSGMAGEEQRARTKQPLSDWGKNSDGKVQLYLIDFQSCELGLVTNSAADFSYELCLEDLALRLEATTIDWLPDMSESARMEAAGCVVRFHSLYIKCEDGLPEMALVKVKSGKPDFQRMEEILRNSPVSVPWWLPSIVVKMERLNWWEAVRLSAPTNPPPSPMKLHMIFDEGATPNEEQEFSAGRKTLAQVGRDSLELLKSVTEAADAREKPVSMLSGPELEWKINDFLAAERLADLIVGSYLPYVGTRQDSDIEALAEMLLALVGAYKLESGTFSVARLWTWLTGSKDSSLEKGNANTAGCLGYLGRTPSYRSFGEVEPPDEEKDGTGQLYLKVRYEEYDDAFYRWIGSHAEEKRPDVPGAASWRRLVWNPILGTFCSPSILLPDGKHRPLPNKVCAWLRGRGIKKLIVIKQIMEVKTSMPYVYLKEEEVESGVQEKGTMLIVVYDPDIRVCYCRSPRGGLGVEIDQHKRVHMVSYCEAQKTLLSQVGSGSALPRKVVSWLLDDRCLADLIPRHKKKARAGVAKDDQGVVSWTDAEDLHEYLIHAKATQCGRIYQVKDSENGEWKSLTYSQSRKAWLVYPDRQDGGAVVVPGDAISAIDTDVGSWGRTNDLLFSAPQKLNTPVSAKLLFPHLSGTDLAEIEQVIEHRFKQPRLLAEALTHCSAPRASVMSCELLAVVGEVALKSFASDLACRRDVAYFTGLSVVRPGAPACRGFCAPKDWPGWASTKSSDRRLSQKEGAGSLDSVYAFRCWLRACCNHVSYAHSCVKLKLHKAVHKACISGLEEAIGKFAKRAENKSPKKWGRLFEGGAPKVLGDVFLACVGAIVMDSDHSEVEKILMDHCNECKDFKVDMPSSVSRRPDDTGLTKFSFQKAAARAGISISPWVVNMENASEGDGKDDFKLACACSDVWIGEVEGQVLIGNSPRAATSRLSFEDASDASESEDLCDDKEPGIVDGDRQGSDDTLRSPEHEGAIYCRYCERWLNGPTQWADHEIGRKHRKAVRLTQADKGKGKGKGKDPPAIPAGFGQTQPKVTKVEDASHAFVSSEHEQIQSPATSYGTTGETSYSSGTYCGSGGWQGQEAAKPVFGYYINAATGEWMQGHLITLDADNAALGGPENAGYCEGEGVGAYGLCYSYYGMQ